MANLASRGRTSADDARLEAAAARALDARRGRSQIAPPPSAGRYTAAILTPLLKGAGASLSDLQRAWAEIVGDRLAGLTHPEKLTRGDNGATLVVVVHASAAPFVQHQQGLIIERANLAGAGVKRLQIRQGALPARAANVRLPTKPLSIDEEKALAATLAPIQSDLLRAALFRLGRAVSGS